MTATNGVRETLRAAWSRAMPAGAAGDGHFEELIARYSEPHRRYHTVTHLHDVVEGVEALSQLCTDPTTTLLAAFFHDAVYVIGAADNEAASAELATRTLRDLGLPRSTGDRVGELVIVTASTSSRGTPCSATTPRS